MQQILKYPRTRHIEGSREQFGDEDMNLVSLEELAGCYLVVEEKMDGANCGISFDDQGDLLLQSRGHYLTGGPRERHFALLKTWAGMFQSQLFDILTNRYVMYGEWMYAKHTVYYDALPHYFLEFDIFDKQEQVFLSTNRRRAMLAPYPFIHSVRVLQTGICNQPEKLFAFVGPSYAITDRSRDHLLAEVGRQGLRDDRALNETDLTGIMEGLYIKEEDSHAVKNRYKYIRGGFLAAVLSAEGHWHSKPIIPNRLINDQVMYEMD